MKKWMMQGVGVLVGLLTLTATVGCGTVDPATVDAVGEIIDEAIARYDEPDTPVEQPGNGNGLPPARQPERGEGTPSPEVRGEGTTAPSSDDFAGLKFRNSQDCRGWLVTVTISNVRVEGGNIAWDEAKGQREARKWNVKTGRKSINGETILLLPSISTAGMFDFLGVGQTRKILSNLKPSHEGPGFFPGWVPKTGERVGFCIATISRDKGAAKMQERSNVVWFEWPRDGI